MKSTVIRILSLVGLTGFLGVCLHAKSDIDAQRKPVVLELFTSEGCSSCPPADRLLQSLDENQPFPGAGLIVLSEHVDYWNGDGWVDPYSSRFFSERQRQYAEQFGLEGVYTPQAVVDGQQEIVGSNAAAVRNAVTAATGRTKIPIAISEVARDGDRVKLHLDSGAPQNSDGPAAVYVALADNTARSNVAGGENGGRSLTHVAVVRVFANVGTVRPGDPFSKDVMVPGADRLNASGFRVVAFLQTVKSHKIIAAAEEKMGGQ